MVKHQIQTDATIRRKLQFPTDFPDLATCRTKPSGLCEALDCLNLWGSACNFSVIYQSRRFCRHPDGAQMLEV